MTNPERRTTCSTCCNRMLARWFMLCGSGSSPFLHLCCRLHQMGSFIHSDIALRYVLSLLLSCPTEAVMNISKDQRSEQHLSITWSDVRAVTAVWIHTSPFERSLNNSLQAPGYVCTEYSFILFASKKSQKTAGAVLVEAMQYVPLALSR